MLSCQSMGCCRGLRTMQSSVSPPVSGGAPHGRQPETFNLQFGRADGSRLHVVRGAGNWTTSVLKHHSVETQCFGGNGDNGGAGRNNRGSGSGDNNNDQNNNTGGGNGFGDKLRRCSGPALLGAMGLVAASAAFPAATRATPGTLSGLLHIGGGGGSSKAASPPLSSSAPTRCSGFLCGSGGESLDRASLSRSSLGGSLPSASTSTSGSHTSPSRPRSKVMHVSCKGSTLVVPLTGANDPNGVGISAGALPTGVRLLPWQRRKIVEAPVELSEREARMLAARQNRVRDSLLVQ